MESDGSYFGGGIGDCWGISAGALYDVDGTNWVDLVTYMYMPEVRAAFQTLGYRWRKEPVNVRVIGNDIGNMQTEVTLKIASNL